MRKRGALTRTLTIAGTVLAWFPIVATLGTAVPRMLGRGEFQVDYLMPAELFPVAVVAGALLLWAALRARSRVAPIGWGLGLMVGMLAAGQVLAVVTGLASGAAEPTGAAWAAVVASLVFYTLLIVELGVAGVFLIGDVFSTGAEADAAPPPAGGGDTTG
jgi:hypothetical protein